MIRFSYIRKHRLLWDIFYDSVKTNVFWDWLNQELTKNKIVKSYKRIKIIYLWGTEDYMLIHNTLDYLKIIIFLYIYFVNYFDSRKFILWFMFILIRVAIYKNKII